MGHRLHREDLLWQLCPRQGSIDISNKAMCLNGKTKSLQRVEKFKANNFLFFALQGVNQMRHRIRALQGQAGWRPSASNHASKIISLWWCISVHLQWKSYAFVSMVRWLYGGAISLTWVLLLKNNSLFWFSSTSLHKLLYFLVLSDFNIIIGFSLLTGWPWRRTTHSGRLGQTCQRCFRSSWQERERPVEFGGCPVRWCFHGLILTATYVLPHSQSVALQNGCAHPDKDFIEVLSDAEHLQRISAATESFGTR